MKHAFKQLNTNNKGWISQEDLKAYCTKSQLSLNEDQLANLFKFLDQNGDGKIRYYEFQAVIGSYLRPQECLYFRQDRTKERDVICIDENCWQPPYALSNYCTLHYMIAKE